MIKDFCFESERLVSTQLQLKDSSTLFKIYSDKDAMKYRGSKPMESIEDAFYMINNQLNTNDNFSKLRLGIKTKPKEKLIGTLLLVKNENKLNEFEVGLSFGKDYWGKGYALETLNMVEKELKTHYGICNIKAWCRKENIASIKLFKKANYIEQQQNIHPKSLLFIKPI